MSSGCAVAISQSSRVSSGSGESEYGVWYHCSILRELGSISLGSTRSVATRDGARLCSTARISASSTSSGHS